MIRRSYSKLSRLETFDQRFKYLKLSGEVGATLFGDDRPLNQMFYRSKQWKDVRNFVIVRDSGFDLGIPGYDIVDRAVVHHMNPVQLEDLEDWNPELLDPEYLILVSAGTHRAIHYGDEHLIPRLSTERRPGDTQLW